MSYYNPKIYNKEHLPEDQRNEMQYWFDFVKRVVNSTLSDLTEEEIPSMLDKIKSENYEEFVQEFLTNLAVEFDELTVAIIDGADDEPLNELEEYTQWCDDIPLPKDV